MLRAIIFPIQLFFNINFIRIFVWYKTRVMTTKLTLTIEEDVIKAAKLYARKKGRSVSDLVETYLKNLAGKDKAPDDLSPQVKRLIGSVRVPDDFDYKEELSKQIKTKHKK